MVFSSCYTSESTVSNFLFCFCIFQIYFLTTNQQDSLLYFLKLQKWFLCSARLKTTLSWWFSTMVGLKTIYFLKKYTKLGIIADLVLWNGITFLSVSILVIFQFFLIFSILWQLEVSEFREKEVLNSSFLFDISGVKMLEKPKFSQFLLWSH